MLSQNASALLYQVAEIQKGYFTSHQAVEAGIQDNNHAYYVRAGKWIRQWRGVYRLSQFPFQEDEQYALWAVWSINRKGEMLGIFSHETALSLYDLTDVNPTKIHLTVPPGFRRHSSIPPMLILHYSLINPSECEDRGGYKVTKPFRTIADLVRSRKLPTEFIIQAIREGLQTGKLTRSEYEELRRMPRVGKPLREMLKGRRVAE
jgi:predicted transcriptional regulator of viral defense system